MEDKIKKYINQLSIVTQLTNVFNQYSFEFPDNKVRRENLLLYLTNLSQLRPKIILVGEAPGYHGCRLTGVPFTSEHILLNNDAVFGKRRGYQKTTEVIGFKKEQTATIIWETILTYNVIPLMWNAFPFHPHEPGNLQKNRTPSNRELELGLLFLEKIIEIYDIEQVVAIGKKAETSLAKLEIPCTCIRHPANGGKLEFVEGIGAFLAG